MCEICCNAMHIPFALDFFFNILFFIANEEKRKKNNKF